MAPEDIKNIEKQIKELEDTIEAERVARNGLYEKIAKAQEDETFNISQFQKYHNIIYYYELEIEGITGKKIAAPISEHDIEKLADNGGRLYRGIDGTDSKIIPELVGGGIFPGLVPFELDRRFYIDTTIQILRTGTGESRSSSLVGGYSGGDTTVELQYNVGDNIWAFLGQSVLVKLGVGVANVPEVPETPPGGTPAPVEDPTWFYPIVDRLRDGDTSQGVIVFNGFSNAARLSKNGGALQGCMNTLESIMGLEVMGWLNTLLEKTYRGCDNNADTNFDQIAWINASDTKNYLEEDYMIDVPLDDSAEGLTGLTQWMDDRQFYMNGTRVNEIMEAKKFFYDLRINFVNLRGDIQSGSLTRVRYMSTLAEEIPEGGSAQQQKALQVLRSLLV